MLSEIINLANESQGVAVWMIVLIVSLAWVRLNARINQLHQYMCLRFGFMDEQLQSTKEDIKHVANTAKNFP